MGFVFRRDETVAKGVKRIALEELEDALVALRGESDMDVVEAIHDSRKRCKKIRALIRLARPGIGRHFAPTNARARDAARELSATRDAQALALTFARMLEHGGDADAENSDLSTVSDALDRASLAASESSGRSGAHAGRAIDLLVEIRDSVERWPLGKLSSNRRGFSGVRPGLTTTYDLARRSMSRSRHHPDPDAFHEWRKHAKYGWYHLRLVRRAAPSVLEPLSNAFGELADTLGDAHDLAELVGKLRGSPEQFGHPDAVTRAIELIDRNRAELERRALGVGARLYAEPPTIFGDRLEAYWRVWQRDGDEHVIGSIDVVLDDLIAAVDPT